MTHKLNFLIKIVHLPESTLRKDHRRTAYTKIGSSLCDDNSSGPMLQIRDVCEEYVRLHGKEVKLCRVFVDSLDDDPYKGMLIQSFDNFEVNVRWTRRSWMDSSN